MRRSAWTGSAIAHLVVLCLLLLLQVRVPEPPPSYVPMSLLDRPEVPEQEQEPAEPAPLPEEGPEEGEPVDREETAGGPGGPSGMESVGVRPTADWVEGPPPIQLPEMDTRALARARATSPIREALAGGGYHPLGDAAATAVDTLLWAQQRLEWLAERALAEAKAAPKDHGILEPAPRPGSMQEMRGEPMMPLMGLAAAGAKLLAEVGEDVWNRILGRDPDAVQPPEMDLTYQEVLAFAALHDHRGLTVFEWYGRLAPAFQGGLGDLQQVAAGLADKRMLRLDAREEGFLYRRTVALQDVVDYYVSFLTRLPPGEQERREALEQVLAALVREPGL